SGETWVQLPQRFKTVLRVQGDRSVTLVQVLNGDSAWVTVDGQPQKVEPTALAEMHNAFAGQRALRLVALLQDRTLMLTLLPEARVNDRPADVVRVVGRDQKDLRLYFDRETGLLVKAEYLLTDGAGKEQRQE